MGYSMLKFDSFINVLIIIITIYIFNASLHPALNKLAVSPTQV